MLPTKDGVGPLKWRPRVHPSPHESSHQPRVYLATVSTRLLMLLTGGQCVDLQFLFKRMHLNTSEILNVLCRLMELQLSEAQIHALQNSSNCSQLVKQLPN